MNSLDLLIHVDSRKDFSPEVIERVQRACQESGCTGKTIFVANGLQGSEFAELEKVLRAWRDIVLIELSKRFGESAAILAGLAEARAERVFVSDARHVQTFETLLGALSRDPEPAELYWGISRRSGDLRSRLFRYLTGVTVPGLATGPCLLSRAFVHDLLKFREIEIFLPVACERVGRVQKTVDIPDSESLNPSEGLMYAIRNSSERPLNLLFALSVFVFALTLLSSAAVFIFKLENELLPGWASTIILLNVTFGTVIFALGWIALYTGRIYSEIKRRPVELIRNVWAGPSAPGISVALRPVRPADLDYTFKWHNDPGLAAQIMSYPPPITLETERNWLNGLAELEQQGRRWVRMIEITRGGKSTPVGFVDLKPVDPEKGIYGLGILVGESEWRGHGVGKRAMELLRDWARAEFSARQLTLVVRRDNDRAIQFYSSFGFTASGTENADRGGETVHLQKMSLHL